MDIYDAWPHRINSSSGLVITAWDEMPFEQIAKRKRKKRSEKANLKLVQPTHAKNVRRKKPAIRRQTKPEKQNTLLFCLPLFFSAVLLLLCLYFVYHSPPVR